MPHNETQRRLQRTLLARQDLADAATSALAHGRRRADTLYARLAELEDQLERDHPQLVQRLFPEWATRDAEQLGRHTRGDAPTCADCQAARDQHRAPTTLRSA